MKNVVGRVKAIYIFEKKNEPRRSVSEALFEAGYGIVGDRHAGDTRWQVSFFEQACIEAIQTQNLKGFCTHKFSENVTTEGLSLNEMALHDKLAIGTSVHEVTQVGKTCYEDCPIRQSGQSCPISKAGLFTRVISRGVVKVGDAIVRLDEVEAKETNQKRACDE